MSWVRKNQFFLRRLHSLTGVVPVGLFLLQHLYLDNYFAIRGPESYNKLVAFIQSLPYLPLLEWGLIFIPLYFHAFFGLVLYFEANHNILNYRHQSNINFWLRRVTGIVTLVFVTWHLYQFRFQKFIDPNFALNFDTVAAGVSHPAMFAWYVIGTVCASWHFGNGLWSFAVHWGITIGPRSQKAALNLGLAVFVTMSAVGIWALARLAGFLE